MRRFTVGGLALSVLMIFLPAITQGQQFQDVSDEAGLINEASKSWGNPIWGDINNDGYLDLIIPTHGLNVLPRHPYVYINNGNGTFSDAYATSGIQASGLDSRDWHGYAFGDFDGDGNLDLFITEGAKRGALVKRDLLFKGLGNGQFINVTSSAGIEDSANRGRSGFWVDYNNDGNLDLFVKNFHGKNCLYRNNGDGTFTDVAQSAGLANVTAGTDSGTTVSWADYDHDGYMDVFIAGDNTRDALFRNQGDGTFVDVTASTGIAPRLGGKGIAWGDYNNDGFLDVYIARGDQGNQNFSRKDTLYKNNGNGTFVDMTDATGLATTANTWSANWGDYNNDGLLDLFVTNPGLPIGTNNSCFLYHNNGDGTFTNVSNEVGLALADSIFAPKGAAWGDYDNDGFLDLIIKNGIGSGKTTGFFAKGTHRLYRNLGNENNYLKVNLVGKKSNRQGIGAKLILTTSDGFQYRENNGGGGGELFSQGSEPIHFGLGIVSKAELFVFWPSGIIDHLINVPANSTITVTEGML